jgi:hypothetical protein
MKKSVMMKSLYVCIPFLYLAFMFGCNPTPPPDGNTPVPMDFYAVFPTNMDLGQTPGLSFLIAGGAAVSGTVSATGLGYSADFTTDDTGLATVTIPALTGGMQDALDTVQGFGFFLHSSDAVSVVAVSDIIGSMGAYAIPPATQLGTAFLVMSAGSGGSIVGSFLSIVASEDSTSVEIVPTATASGHLPGAPYTITLNKYETIELQADSAADDLSGTQIGADKPVAVFGGHALAQVPTCTAYASFLCTPIPPIAKATGKTFVAAPFQSRTGYRLRIMGLVDGTSITYLPSAPGGGPLSINRGQFGEFADADVRYIQADHPILVAQYSLGGTNDTDVDPDFFADPSMTLVPAVEQFAASYVFSTPTRNVTSRYANLVVATASTGSIKLNDVAVGSGNFTAISGSSYSTATISLPAGVNRLTGDGAKFSAVVYGYGGTVEENQFTFTP